MTLTPIQRRILTASGAIVDGHADDPLYTHSVLAQTYFPTTKQLTRSPPMAAAARGTRTLRSTPARPGTRDGRNSSICRCPTGPKRG